MAGIPSWADGEQSQKKRLKKRLLYIWPLSTSKRLWGGRRGRRAGGTEARGRRQDEKKENILSWAERSDAGRWVRFEPSRCSGFCRLCSVLLCKTDNRSKVHRLFRSGPHSPIATVFPAAKVSRYLARRSRSESGGREKRENRNENKRNEHRNARVEVTAMMSQHRKDSKGVDRSDFLEEILSKMSTGLREYTTKFA